jgi:hypothetical protein
MQKQVVQLHIWLKAKDDMPEQWQRLGCQLNRKCFIKPDAGDTQAIDIETQGKQQ